MVYLDHRVDTIEIAVIEELFCEFNKIRQSFSLEERAGLQFCEPSCPINEQLLIESLFYNLIPRLEERNSSIISSNFSLTHSANGILSILSCQFSFVGRVGRYLRRYPFDREFAVVFFGV